MKLVIGDNMALSFSGKSGNHQTKWVCIDAMQCNLLRCSQVRDA